MHLRCCTHPDSGHESASHLLLTGYKPTNDIPAQEVPSYGSIVSKELGPRAAGFPAYVAVPGARRSAAAAYLGVAYNPFETLGDPNSDNFQVRNLQTAGRRDDAAARASHGHAASSLDTIRRDVDASRHDRRHGRLQPAGLGPGHLAGRAAKPSTSTKEDADAARSLRPTTTGARTCCWPGGWSRRACGSSRSTWAAGTRTATTSRAQAAASCPSSIAAFAALIEDLDQRGRLDNTLVLVWGEFGRTPRINPQAGRDHWPNVFTVVMAGGGLKRGVILGESDARAEFPKERPISPQDVLATMYHQLGINRHKSYINDANRPVEILNYGEPIDEIIA